MKLKGGCSSTLSILRSVDRSAQARFRKVASSVCSKCDSCRLGIIQVSNGKRGAHGSSTSRRSVSVTTRTPAEGSCRRISQKTQLSLKSKYPLAPSNSSFTRLGMKEELDGAKVYFDFKET